ncbi:GntG family PLP-dependent aldolase [Oceanobacillus profundus]|uniref:GntG family PLP-dependent aldolase n=1 Tax=Oceanobacillus TaxID=182709 RepID=UPI0026E30D0A|nr:GntG family PLP-dependent aldolase [Oceanobacillus profundus]
MTRQIVNDESRRAMLIDLRSDTLTKPIDSMRQAMFDAVVGDDGRTSRDGKGEDPTVNRLEDLAAKVTGKEDAMFCNSGTIGNIIALMTHCTRGDLVAVGANSHLYKSEKSPFMESYFGLDPVLYEADNRGVPRVDSLASHFRKRNTNLLCLENSNNFFGGACMSAKETKAICELANEYSVPVHLDGARIFNVAAYYDLPVSDLVAPVDSVMFSVSKGLGAPIGSLLCGSKAFIKQARSTRKLLGGGMRQVGIIAAAGIIGIEIQSQRLKEDHEHAYLLASKIVGNTKIKVNLENVQTNIVIIDVSNSGYSAAKFEMELAERGLYVKAVSNNHIRMTTYHGISTENVEKAAVIFNQYCHNLKEVDSDIE